MKEVMARAALVSAGALLTVALLEGLTSILLFGRDFAGWRDHQNAEFRHAQYDAQLGWVNIPNVSIPDMYGPGRDLHTNAQGFRGRSDTPDAVTAGRRRAVCSGDSFTLGYGVSDEQTWCALLAALVPNLETVNMGQGGYGFDQAYLWYRRDGMRLAQDIHVFAFITDDFRRMQSRRFDGYGKPRLAVVRESLVVTDVPARRRGALVRLAHRTMVAARGLRLVQLADRIARRRSTVPERGSPAGDSATRVVATKAFQALATFHLQRGSRLILVYLPVREDSTTEMSTSWRAWMQRTAAGHGVAFIDLVAAMRVLPPDSVRLLFRPSDGHYTATGNRWVAERLGPAVIAAASEASAGAPLRESPPNEAGSGRRSAPED